MTTKTETTAKDIADQFKAYAGEVLEGDYRGNPMMIIRVTPLDKFPFQFVYRKARLILAHIEEIKAFAEKHASL